MKKRIVVICAIVLIGLCLLFLRKNNESQQTSVSVENPEKITQIQFCTMRIPRKEYPSKKLEALFKYLEDTTPVESKIKNSLKRNEDFVSLLLIYGDGSKDKFFFFQDSGKWYMETDEGFFYENAEFIEDYITIQKLQEPESGELIVNPEVLEIYLTLLKEHKDEGAKFDALYQEAAYQKQGYSEEEAKQKAAQKIEERQNLFEYAKESGIYPSEDEQTEIIENYILDVKTADNYEEFEKLCMQSQFSVEDVLWAMKDSILENEISNRFYYARRQEFMEGNDTVEGQVCDDIREYCQMFLKEYVYRK